MFITMEILLEKFFEYLCRKNIQVWAEFFLYELGN